MLGGVTESPLLSGRQRQPLWPTGVVGSITHCEGYCAAVVAYGKDFASIGIDAEPNEPLPFGVLNLVSGKAERIWLQGAPKGELCWDRLLFCIKESVYKVWFPITNAWLDFEQALVEVDPRASTFKATILHPDILFPRMIEGRYLAADSILLTCAWLTTLDSIKI
jgi:4'-phosphopantetheinyl transferase EntD